MDYLRNLEKYRFLRYQTANPYDGCRELIDKIESFNRMMGISFLDRKHNFVRFSFIFPISALIIYGISMILTTYHFRNEITKVIYCLATCGFGSQAVMKIYSFIITRQKVISLNETNFQYYRMMLQQSERAKGVLCSNLSLIFIVARVAGLAYLVLTILTVAIPGLSSIILNQRILPLGFYLPFIERDTWAGFCWNYGFQILIAMYYWLITVATDMMTIFNLLTACGQLDVLMALIEELNEAMDRDAPADAIRSKIIEITQLHQHHRAYLQCLVSFLNLYHLVAVSCSVLAMILSVGVVLLGWYPGIAMAFLVSAQLFYICFLGTSLEIKTDALTEKVCAVSWSKLSVVNMKHMKLVLAMTQKPKLLVVATTPLNISAFVQIHKMIYSFVMMILNTRD